MSAKGCVLEHGPQLWCFQEVMELLRGRTSERKLGHQDMHLREKFNLSPSSFPASWPP
jgi:hypothetical protein